MIPPGTTGRETQTGVRAHDSSPAGGHIRSATAGTNIP